MNEQQSFQRRYPAHPTPIDRFNRPIILFVTACIRGRQPLLASHQAHTAVVRAWDMTSQWRTCAYVILPDHVHLFCVPRVCQPESVKTWTGYWKRVTGDLWPPLRHNWQRDVWDTQMRSAAHFMEKLSYMRQNPVRLGLVDRAENWPFASGPCDVRW